MTERTSHEPGAFCWIDLNAPDPGAAAAFYTSLFGWHPHPDPDPAANDHTMLTLDGDLTRPVAALMRMIAGAPPGTPAFWTTYVTVTDVDATAEVVREAGGRVFMGPMDAKRLGRFALLFDPWDAVIGLWQPADFHGAGVMGVPNSYCWSELAVDDAEAAKAFYGTVLPQAPEQIVQATQGPSRWTACFAVTDCGATASRAADLGGTVLTPPRETPDGQTALLMDSQGAHFAIYARTAERGQP